MIGIDEFIIATDLLTEFRKSFQEIPLVDQTIQSLQTTKTEVKDMWSEIKNAYNFCLTSNEEPSDDDLQSIKHKYNYSSTVYVSCLSEIIDGIRKLEIIKSDLPEVPSSLPTNINFSNTQSLSSIKVPPCDTENFHGDYLGWPSFRDLFTAVYINHPKLCCVQKLFYLRSKTKGEAYNIVSKFPLTSDSFALAWKALSDQYDNKRILVNSQLKILFSLPIVNIESGKGIKKLQGDINDCISILNSYKIDTTSWDPFLVFLCSSRLPDKTLSMWEQSLQKPRDIATWSEMDKFLTSQYQILETVNDLKHSSLKDCKPAHTYSTTASTKQNQQHRSFHTKAASFCFPLCKGSHPIRFCSKFLTLSISDRVSKVNFLKLCNNCLSPTHKVTDCQSVHTCMHCGRKHHTLLHFPSKFQTNQSTTFHTPGMSTNPNVRNPTEATISPLNQIQSTPNPNPQVKTFFTQSKKRILLATALIELHHLGSKFTLRALLDPGSEASFISEEAQQRLRLPVKPIQADISGISAVVTTSSSKICSFIIGSKYMDSFSIPTSAFVLKRLTGYLPSCDISPNELSDKIDIQLADPFFYESSNIDFVLGADLYPSIILQGVKQNIFNTLVAQQTVFGWVLSGPLPKTNVQSFSTFVSYYSEISIDEQISKFWEIEELPNVRHLSPEDYFCEQLYSQTTTRDKNGRYTVRLPFKDPSPSLGPSRDIAMKQLVRMERNLSKNPDFQSKYNAVLQEYSTLGHMSLVTPDDSLQIYPASSYYLPHHVVLKPESTTTKLRVVFNASSPSGNGVSLNSILHSGPVLQADLMSLVLRWRFYRYVFCADVEKMYRQILVHPEHSPYQRILFRNSNSDEFQDYELNTVTFGVNCAPYLAIRTIKQLADDVSQQFPIASSILKNDFYVDDVLSGSHTFDSALEAQKQLSLALSSGGFSLRKWTSNSIDFLKTIPQSFLYNKDFLQFEDSSVTKTLGIIWNAKLDSFCFFLKFEERDHRLTKRAVLSVVARLFDPAGWLAPVIVTAKILMQQIWQDGTSWDMPLMPQTCHRWKNYFAALPDIQTIRIPRWIQYTPDNAIQIHGFCDASEKAYAAALYIRLQHSPDSWSSHLLCAKSRVAPLKQIVLPRLELCAAVLLSKLINHVLPQLHSILNYNIILWTDSSIVLAWLDKPPNTWKTFIGNRVSEIQTSNLGSKWRHVRSADNPADLATRGMLPNELQKDKLWWNGPSWLRQCESTWPQEIPHKLKEIDLEQRPIKANITTMVPNIETIIERFDSWPKTVHVMSYVLRFVHRTHPRYREHFIYPSISLSHEEIRKTKMLLIRLTQILYYPKEYSSLSRSQPLSKKSTLLSFNPMIDERDQIIRSNGRLVCSSLSFNERFPILLPYQACISPLLVKFYHKLTLHGGVQLVMRLIRCEFWIPRIKNLIKRCERQCSDCRKHNWQRRTQIMAALPPERTTFSLPFTHTGLDFAGPFTIRSFSGRNCKLSKGYVCVFVCFATKAIHLEATSDLSTPSFMAALNRFVARRGVPKVLYSDNGTNLVGASRVIAKDFKEFLKTFSVNTSEHYSDLGLEWKFIPPGAPHMGGLWEAAVKSFKKHFNKVVGDHKFTFEEFATLLARIESCLNSRPISTISENSSDLPPLTPGHFLRGGPLLAIPEPDLSTQSLSCIKRWEKLKILHHQFCDRWKQEYLKGLHQRYKWKHPERNVSVDDIVVIVDERLSPNEWCLGRVIKVYRGSDGFIRVADVKTQSGILKRPIVKLCVLTSE